MRNLKRCLALLVCASLAACLSLTSGSREGTFTFGMFGDLAYRSDQEPLLDNVIADLSADPNLAFVVHVGDLGSPNATGSCTDTTWTKRFGQFQSVAHPLIFTPGDNDWVDCHGKDAVPGAQPVQRLASLRRLFFPDTQTLGKRRMTLIRQSAVDPANAKYVENARWSMGGVTFLTIHTTGSNNGVGRDAAGDAEARERTAANISWLRAGFAQARADGSRGVMILTQGNHFPGITPFPAPSSAPTTGFVDLRNALTEEVARFSRPVVLVNGDSHYFRIDKPLRRTLPAAAAKDAKAVPTSYENFTRVETFGQPNHHWLEVTVDPREREVFVFRQRIVAANIGKP
jgi:hypothetical protein